MRGGHSGGHEVIFNPVQNSLLWLPLVVRPDEALLFRAARIDEPNARGILTPRGGLWHPGLPIVFWCGSRRNNAHPRHFHLKVRSWVPFLPITYKKYAPPYSCSSATNSRPAIRFIVRRGLSPGGFYFPNIQSIMSEITSPSVRSTAAHTKAEEKLAN